MADSRDSASTAKDSDSDSRILECTLRTRAQGPSPVRQTRRCFRYWKTYTKKYNLKNGLWTSPRAGFGHAGIQARLNKQVWNSFEIGTAVINTLSLDTSYLLTRGPLQKELNQPHRRSSCELTPIAGALCYPRTKGRFTPQLVQMLSGTQLETWRE